MIAFRVDANKYIATGHVMRSLSIAEALRAAGVGSLFFTADQMAEEMIAARGFVVKRLDSRYNALDAELETLCSLLSQYSVSKLFVDSYFATASYLSSLRQCCKVAYMGDLQAFVYPADLLVDYTVYADQVDYKALYPNTKLALGCAYAPLRQEFCGVAYHCNDTVRRVLITTGGTDEVNMAEKIARALPEELERHIVVGAMNTHADALDKLAAACGSIVLHRDVREMSVLMQACDIAISAGGSTLYELCACGLPTICYAFADNQLHNVEAFSRKNIMYYAGDCRADEDACLRRIAEMTKMYCTDKVFREQRTRAMRALVDGYGAKRLAGMIAEL